MYVTIITGSGSQGGADGRRPALLSSRGDSRQPALPAPPCEPGRVVTLGTAVGPLTLAPAVAAVARSACAVLPI